VRKKRTFFEDMADCGKNSERKSHRR